MMLKNLAAVVGNYVDAGVRFFVLARAIRERSELHSLRAAMKMPVKVVRLTTPWEEIERRLGSDVTAARQDDLREAAAWVASSVGTGFEDLTIANDGEIREVARGIVDRLGWILGYPNP